MLKAILIDDEANALTALEKDLENYCSDDISILAKCQGAIEGLKAIKKWNPDIVFLDIMMPGMNGFEMLEVLGEINFNVVFVTAYNEYAIDAFNVSAVHYLTKPVDKKKLEEAVTRVKDKYYGTFSKDHLSLVMENIKPYDSNKKLGLPTGDGFEFVAVKDIIYCEADTGLTCIHLKSRKPMYVSRALKDIGKLLSSDDFFRIHSKYLISRLFLEKYVRGDGGYVIMPPSKSLPVARAKKKAFLRWLEV